MAVPFDARDSLYWIHIAFDVPYIYAGSFHVGSGQNIWMESLIHAAELVARLVTIL